MKKIDLLILLILFFAPLQAQCRITGKVTDEKKEPIPGASVVFIQNDSLRGMTLTDKNGKWAVEDFGKGGVCKINCVMPYFSV